MSRLVDRILAVDDALGPSGVPYAFGGALALAYAIDTPRGTADIDLNLFVPPSEARAVLAVLPVGVHWTPEDLERLERDGQARVWFDDTPLDLFFNTADFHVQAAGNARRVAFVDRTIPVLAPNDLAVFKCFFDRRKDWADLEAMAVARTIDPGVVRGWIVRLLGRDDDRVRRLDELFDEVDGA